MKVPSIYELKPRFQALLRPLTNWLAARGVMANQVTIAAAALSILTGVAIYHWNDNRRVLLFLPLVLFIRMALNAIDGMLAREHGMKSARGAILNELGDVVSDAGLYLPLACVPSFRAELVVIAVLLAALTEMAGVVAIQVGASRRYDGPMGKSDRAFVFGALGFFLGLGLQAGEWVNWVVAVVIALLVITVLNRCRRALKEVA